MGMRHGGVAQVNRRIQWTKGEGELPACLTKTDQGIVTELKLQTTIIHIQLLSATFSFHLSPKAHSASPRTLPSSLNPSTSYVMDKLINAGKEFLEERNQGQEAHGGNYPAGGGFQPDDDDDDFRQAREEASARAGSSGNSELFSSILGAIGQNKSRLAAEDIDEEDVVKKHKKSYNDDDDDDDADDDRLGSAAAIQALKLFNQGETGDKQGKGAFIGLALSEASKLFDDREAKGKLSSGASKESTLQKAGEVAMKMYLKSQGEQQGGLMSMASKFM
ncbi:hypothetical protein B0I35DRAFT_225688 [Stachybotrys elegans]|uniref:DUF7721 domain-containing protein n=1 Tax=Stachybotrys elegans TaxID=80388 RepID=A0A8K0WT61_9HYPO|nr:hypothetical protein B0I35DRAFT_225688 [Stachybotrys elegans]